MEANEWEPTIADNEHRIPDIYIYIYEWLKGAGVQHVRLSRVWSPQSYLH